MMKRIHILAFIRLMSATLPVGAASVIPDAATNYYFTTPLRPVHIRGLVMGSPPAYYVPRSEDFDWLNEAYMERVALSSHDSYYFGSSTILVPEFGKWNLSETNRFDRWVTAVDAAGVTNVVIGYNLVTNAPTSNGSPGGQYEFGTYIPGAWPDPILPGVAARTFYNPTHDPYGFLDPDVQLVTQSRTYDLAYFTNVYTVASYTNVVTNSFSTIEMPMTNGTVSVYTNRWEAERTIPVNVACTNVMTLYAIDYCHVGDGPFPGYTNAPPPLITHHHVPTVLSNDYAALRGTLRLADPDPWITNAPPSDIVGKYYFTDRNTVSGTYTNRNDTGYHFTYWIRGSKERIWKELSPGTNAYERIWYTVSEEKFTIPQTRDITVRTRFPSAVVTTGGVARVSLEAAFAYVWFNYSKHQIGTPVPEDGDAGVDVQEMDVTKHVVLRLNASMPLDHRGEISCLRLTLNAKNLLDSAASAIQGVPTPPQNAATFSPPEWHECSWTMKLDGIVLIYRIHPTSKFTDW